MLTLPDNRYYKLLYKYIYIPKLMLLLHLELINLERLRKWIMSQDAGLMHEINAESFQNVAPPTLLTDLRLCSID